MHAYLEVQGSRCILIFVGEYSRISGYPTSMGVFIVIFGICIVFLGLYVSIGGILVDMCINIGMHVFLYFLNRVPGFA